MLKFVLTPIDLYRESLQLLMEIAKIISIGSQLTKLSVFEWK